MSLGRAVVLSLVLLFSSVLRAQSTHASLTGRITDPSKAVIIDARVAAIGAGTNLRYETITNGSGEYYLVSLPPGSYRLEIEKPGFAKLIKPDVFLHVQDALGINFEMKVGSTSESVTVEGGAPLLDTPGATVSTLIDNRFVENMPLNGRSFSALIDLTPGVVLVPNNFFEEGQFSVNGQRPDANSWKLQVNGHTDGVGSDAFNLDLSKKRAAAVKDALIEQFKITGDRLETSGLGKSQPKDTNDTLEGRAHNRRVELMRIP